MDEAEQENDGSRVDRVMEAAAPLQDPVSGRESGVRNVRRSDGYRKGGLIGTDARTCTRPRPRVRTHAHTLTHTHA